MARGQELTLLVIRHAESIANVKKILAGRRDPTPLSKAGEMEAAILTRVLADFDPEAVFSSPLLRCRQTLAIAGVSDPLLDERLVEMDYGRWTGKGIKGLAMTPSWRRIQRDATNFVFPAGESFVHAEGRIRELIADLLRSDLRKVVLATHGDIARMLINHLLNRDLNQFQSIQVSTGAHSKLTVKRRGSANHLDAVIHYINRKEQGSGPQSSEFKLGGE